VPLSRRAFLGGAGALALGALAGGRAATSDAGLTLPLGGDPTAAALAALGALKLRHPGSVPNPSLAPGTETLPQIEHIVVLMMENHSYDNLFGVLDPARAVEVRAPGSAPVAGGTADGFAMTASAQTSWNPYGVTNTNPRTDGRTQHAFLMESTCQLPAVPSQEWSASHNAYAGGKLNGFCTTPITPGSSTIVGPIAMAYWDETTLPFTAALAATFPIADRWFCSVLGQTYPNRRYLIAGTSSGMTDDFNIPPNGVGNAEQFALLAVPAGGTVFDLLTLFGISWRDYNASFPTGTTAELYPLNDTAVTATNEKPMAQFFTDCASGALPSVSFLDPNFGTQSQENPQDMVVGEAVMADVVNAVTKGPKWGSTLLVITYDEHGGYYDHVPPPPALAPDLIPPVVAPGEQTYDGFRRYGFRVPAVVVSPYALANGVTHVVHDHTSVLAMIERKWNLPALTYRDANANDLTDFLDMAALRAGRPTFPTAPSLPAAGTSAGCPLSPATIPPPGSFS
jgi:phospholipase C